MTNEANFGDEASSAQQQADVAVTASVGVDSGLDNAGNEVISEGRPEAAVGVVSGLCEGEGFLSAAAAEAAACAARVAEAGLSATEKKRKRKRDGRAEREVAARAKRDAASRREAGSPAAGAF